MQIVDDLVPSDRDNKNVPSDPCHLHNRMAHNEDASFHNNLAFVLYSASAIDFDVVVLCALTAMPSSQSEDPVLLEAEWEVLVEAVMSNEEAANLEDNQAAAMIL